MSPLHPVPIHPGVTSVPPASSSSTTADAMSLLRGGLAPAKNANWADLLRTGLRQLRADMREHIAAMEGPGGLYDEVRRADPRLACAVSRLRREHGLLSAMVDDLNAWALHDPADPSGLNTVRPRIRELIKQWGSHRRRDHQLAYDAMSLDLGGQD